MELSTNPADLKAVPLSPAQSLAAAIGTPEAEEVANRIDNAAPPTKDQVVAAMEAPAAPRPTPELAQALAAVAEEDRGGLVNPSGPGATQALAAMPEEVNAAVKAHVDAQRAEAVEEKATPSNVVPIKPPVEAAAQAVVAEPVSLAVPPGVVPVDLTGAPPLHPDVVSAAQLKQVLIAFQEKMGKPMTLEAMREACKNYQAMIPALAKIPPPQLADRVERTMTAAGFI